MEEWRSRSVASTNRQVCSTLQRTPFLLSPLTIQMRRQNTFQMAIHRMNYVIYYVPIRSPSLMYGFPSLYYLQVDNIAFVLSNRVDATPEVKFLVRLHHQHVDVAIRSLFRVNYYNEIIHIFRILIAKRVQNMFHSFTPQANFPFTLRSIELILESIIRKRNFVILDTVWNICDETAHRNWSIISIL